MREQPATPRALAELHCSSPPPRGRLAGQRRPEGVSGDTECVPCQMVLNEIVVQVVRLWGLTLGVLDRDQRGDAVGVDVEGLLLVGGRIARGLGDAVLEPSLVVGGVEVAGGDPAPSRPDAVHRRRR